MSGIWSRVRMGACLGVLTMAPMVAVTAAEKGKTVEESQQEIAPWYPAPEPLRPMNTAIPAAEVRAVLADGITVEPGKFNSTRLLNGTWRCSGLVRSADPFDNGIDLDKGYSAADFDDGAWDQIEVPRNWYLKYPYRTIHNPREPFVKGWYRRTFDLTADELRDRAVILHFNALGYEGRLWINGEEAGSHHGDFVPWTVDITRFVKPGRNTIALRVFSDFGVSQTRGGLKAVRSYGAQWSVESIKGGLWQDVELRFEPLIRFSRILVSPELASGGISVDYTVENSTGRKVEAELGGVVTTALREGANQFNAAATVSRELPPGTTSGTLEIKLDRPVLWSPEQPYLYFLSMFVRDGDKILSAKAERFGYREFKVRDGHFQLNGKRIFLFGENIPANGYGGGDSDEKYRPILHAWLANARARGINIVRNAHMPILRQALEVADEIGLMFYDEWSWSFTNAIEEKEFEKRNLAEFSRWIERDYNHPSVVMWSCGNEVIYRDKPEVQRQLDKQVELARRLDRSGRPAGSFSGCAMWDMYGTGKLVTDFIDLHFYLGNGVAPWTHWNRRFDEYYAGSLQHYQAIGARLPFPYIIWECIGFSWGGKTDPTFRANDPRAYANYARSKTDWAQPNGIGYSGTIGLARALSPDGLTYAKNHYGHRLLELMRQDVRIDGFAPWFHGAKLAGAALWNQPVLPGLRGAAGFPPSNLFSKRPVKLELFVVNSTDRALVDATAEVTVMTGPWTERRIGRYPLGGIGSWERPVREIEFELPSSIRGVAQFRITLSAEGKTVGRNFYDIFVQDPAVLNTPLAGASPVALLDGGDETDIETTAAILKALAIPYEKVGDAEALAKFRNAVVPASLHNTGALEFDRDALYGWVQAGGNLLILEQTPGSGSILPDLSVTADPNTFVDLVMPAHPVFSGLTQRNFDTWENPDLGNVITNVISPFSVNSLAAKGPVLGGRKVSTAILEAAVGQGYVFWNQLDAVKLWGRDSAASTYLGNLFRYLFCGGGRHAGVLPLEASMAAGFQVDPERLSPIDLTAHVNRSFTDETDGDGKGGWTDQGINDFRNMPLGRQRAAGVMFEIIDPAKNNDKSCIVLRGSNRTYFPEAVRGIRVGEKLSRIFFLHTCAWVGGEAGCYRMNYADGTFCDLVLVDGKNIGDWWMVTFLSDALPGIMRPNATREEVGTYVTCWENPRPDQEIVSIDFLGAGVARRGEIAYVAAAAPVPVLVAATGERYNPAAIEIRPPFRGECSDGEQPPKIELEKTTLPDGSGGEAIRVEFPAVSGKGMSWVSASFDPSKYSKEGFRYLTFWIKPAGLGALDISLPGRDRQGAMSRSIEIGTKDRDWTRIRLNLGSDLKWSGKAADALAGELLICNGQDKKVFFPRPAVSFLISGIVLE